jgi:hypothetical protein
VYSGLFLLVIFVSAILFTHFNLFHTDVNSARYMLSALVQSQAAIVAIVITLTLIAVQLTASAYSPRVIDIFKKNPDMWILLGCYGVSIFYGFIVLKLVEGEAVSQSAIWSLGPISISFEFCVSLAYWLGAFTFVALFPYMWNIISLLKSENIIKRLAVKITRDKILNSKEDPFQPIMDIIHGSIMKYDLETTRVGLKQVTDQVLKSIDLDSEGVISRRFCNYLHRIVKLSVSRADEDITSEGFKNFVVFGKSNAEKGFKQAILRATWSISEVGIAAAKNGLEDVTGQAAESIGEVGIAAAKNGLEPTAAPFLSDVGIAAVENGLGRALDQVLESFRKVGIAAAENRLEKAGALELFRVGLEAAKNGLEHPTWKATCFISEVGGAAAKNGLEFSINQAEVALLQIGKASVENGFPDLASDAVRDLALMGNAAAEKGFEEETTLAVDYIAEVEKAAMKYGIERATVQATWSISEVGRAAAKSGLNSVLEHATRYLFDMGIWAAKEGLDDATGKAAKSLAGLTSFNEGGIKTKIQEHESKLEEKDRESFQKFMKLYEQELEKLRAEKHSE